MVKNNLHSRIVKTILATSFSISCLSGFSQNNILISQYFKVIPVFAPGLNGANDFLDIRTGTRQQLTGFEGQPSAYFLSVSGVLNNGENNPNRYNSLRVDKMKAYNKKKVKIGAGGYLLNDQSGAINQLEAMVSGAVHVLATSNTYLSVGISTGLNHISLNTSDVFVLNPANDLTYQQYLQDGYEVNQLKITTGIAAHSDRFYVSYSLMSVGNNTSEQGEAISTSRSHTGIGGVTINVNSRVEVIPNMYIRYTKDLPINMDYGIRLRFQQNPYLGVSVRNQESLIAMFGFSVNDLLNVGYSYEFPVSDSDNRFLNNHELVLGLQLFNYRKHVPMW